MAAAAAADGRDKQVSQECLIESVFVMLCWVYSALLRCMMAAAAAAASAGRGKQVSGCWHAWCKMR
jgi:hypothetical protein